MSHARSNLVYFDGFCPSCRSAAQLIERLDWLGKFEVVSFRHEDSYRHAGLTTAQLERAMHVVIGQRAFGGFDAVAAISMRLPLLWPFLPALWLAKLTGVGDRLYRFLAARRIIVADTTSCDGAACDVVPAGARGSTDAAGLAEAAIRSAQEVVRRYVPDGVSLADELSTERREAAASE